MLLEDAPMGAEFRTLQVFIFSLLGLLGSVAWYVQFQYHAMMHQTINRGSGCHRVFEDHLPLTERQITRYQNAASFIPVGQQCKQLSYSII